MTKHYIIPSNKDDAVEFFKKNVKVGSTFIILEYFEVGDNVTTDKTDKDLYDIYTEEGIITKHTIGMIDYLDCLGLTLEFIE